MPDRIQKELALLVTGKDAGATKTLKNVKREVIDLEKHAGRATRNAARNIEHGFMVAGAAAVGAIGFAVKAAGDFEAQLNTINTVARATPAELEAIGNGIREISRETGTTTEDLTAGYYDLVSAGIKAADAQGVLRNANTLAIGGLSTTAEAVDLLTTAINTYGGDTSKAGQYTDEFAKAIERGKVTAADIASTYAQVGPLAAQLGIENRELAAGYARLTAGGQDAGESATQMNAALTALIKKTGGLKKLEKQTGKNYAAIAGSQGLGEAYQQLRDDADDAGTSLTDLLGRKEALLYLLQVTGPNQAAYNADLAAMGDAAGTAAGQMGERQKGLNHQIALLKANVHDAAITIGSELLPEFTALAQEGVSWLQDHQPEIKAFAKDLAVGVRDTVKWARSLDWDAITASLQAGATFGKTLIEAFVNAPPWVQQFLAAGFVANKFTGGVIGDVVGQLATGLIKGVLGMNAGVVNINAGVVNGGGGPTGLLPGGAGLSGLLKGLLKLGVGAAGVGVVANSNAATGGIGGHLGNVAGGAMAGSLFGPLGMLAGGLAGSVKSVAENESAKTAAQAAEIKTGLDQSIAGKTLPELRTALGGVEQGIARIQSNPLMTLLHGDALNTLIAMRDQLTEQIATTSRAGDRIGYLTAEQAKIKAQNNARAIEQAAAVKDTKTAVNQAANKAAYDARMVASGQARSSAEAAARTVAATAQAESAARTAGLVNAAATRSQTAALIAAIWGSGRANKSVVQPTTVIHSNNEKSRTGPTGGSREIY